MNDNAKEVLTTYFSDMENNTTLQNRLNNDAGAMVFLLKILRASAESVSPIITDV